MCHHHLFLLLLLLLLLGRRKTQRKSCKSTKNFTFSSFIEPL
jgi:hypothetical protein